jgi:hypothetical protein
MSLKYIWEKIKSVGEDLYIYLIIILIGLLGYGLGRLSKIEESRVPITIKSSASLVLSKDDKVISETQSGQFVASRNGKAYYAPWCAGVSRIKPENKIWFKNSAEAEGAGYKKASGCNGL